MITNGPLHAFRCKNMVLYMSVFDIYVRHILDYSNNVWNLALCRDVFLELAALNPVFNLPQFTAAKILQSSQMDC